MNEGDNQGWGRAGLQTGKGLLTEPDKLGGGLHGL